MIVTSTDGYILSVFGPFLTDAINNDASIIKHCLFENKEGILNWLLDDDVIILDRGFRDAISSMKMIGLQPAMPDFLTGGKKQFDATQANRTRCITKVRWVVESGKNLLFLRVIAMNTFFVILVNAKIKQWRFLAQTIQLSNIKFLSDYVSIVCALSKLYL